MIGWRVVLWAALVGVALAFLYAVRGILLPFILALVVSAVLDPSIRRLQKRGWNRKRSVISVSLVFLGIVLALGIWLTPVVSAQVLTLKEKFDTITTQLAAKSGSDNYFMRWNPRYQGGGGTNGQIDQWFASNRDLLRRMGLPTTRREAFSEYVEPHRQEITKAVETFFGGVLGVVSGLGSNLLLLLFAPVFAIMILLDLDRFKVRAASMIPPAIRADTVALGQDVSDVFVRYLRGVSIVLVYYAIAAAIVLSLLGAPYALLLAGVFALVYLIPYLGPIINMALLVLLTGMSGRTGNLFMHLDSSWSFAAAISAIYFVIFLLFDPLVYTRIVGKSVGLHPLVSFFVVFSGAALFGPVGMILAFPVAGSVKIILDKLLKVTSKPQELQLPAVPLRHRQA